MSKARGEKKKTEPVKENSTGGGKITGKIGSDLRKAEYDKKGWKYDETIKGYNKSGNKINDNKTAKVRAPKVSVESKLTKAPSYDTSKITSKSKVVTPKKNRKDTRQENKVNRKATRQENRTIRKNKRVERRSKK